MVRRSIRQCAKVVSHLTTAWTNSLYNHGDTTRKEGCPFKASSSFYCLCRNRINRRGTDSGKNTPTIYPNLE